MGRRNDRHLLFLVQFPQQLDDLPSRLPVQVARGLVREDDGRIVGQCAGHGDALLLPAGQFQRLVLDPFAEPHQRQQIDAFVDGLVRRQAGENHRQGDVLQGGHDRDQVEGLKDVADLAAPQPGQFVGVQLGDVDLVDIDLALRGLVQRADHVEQGGLARARRAHDGDVLPALDLHVDALERLQGELAHLVHPLDPAGAHDILGFGIRRVHYRGLLFSHFPPLSGRLSGLIPSSKLFRWYFLVRLPYAWRRPAASGMPGTRGTARR